MIEILKFEMINKGSLIARFDVKMHKWGGAIIKGWTLFQSSDKKWVNPPSKEYEVDGKKKYAPYIFFEDRSMNDAYKGAVMKAAEEHKSKIGGNVTINHNEEIPF